jgi:hypothetical protein
MLDKTIKEAHSPDAAIPNSQTMYSTIPEKLQKYTDIAGKLTRIWQMNAVYTVPLVNLLFRTPN